MRPADSAAVADLVTLLGYDTTGAEMQERMTAVQADDSYVTLVAERDGAIAGFVGARIGQYYERTGRYGQILILSIAEDSRRQGVGRALVDAAEAWARSRGAQAILVNSGRQREEAHLFYEGMGYSATGLRFVKALE
jgi:GNAT superfamily N-acetyltransferase